MKHTCQFIETKLSTYAYSNVSAVVWDHFGLFRTRSMMIILFSIVFLCGCNLSDMKSYDGERCAGADTLVKNGEIIKCTDESNCSEDEKDALKQGMIWNVPVPKGLKLPDCQ